MAKTDSAAYLPMSAPLTKRFYRCVKCSHEYSEWVTAVVINPRQGICERCMYEGDPVLKRGPINNWR